MLASVGDVELYAEVETGEDETATYEALKSEIVEQAKRHGISLDQLSFWYD